MVEFRAVPKDRGLAGSTARAVLLCFERERRRLPGA